MENASQDLHELVERTVEKVLSGHYDEYLHCDGRELSKRDYPELAKVLGHCYGKTSPTHFCLPDNRQHYIVTQSKSHAIGSVLLYYVAPNHTPKRIISVDYN